MNPKLEAVVSLAADDLKALARECSDKIMDAWAASVEEAALQDTKPKFAVTFKVTLDLDKNHQSNDLSWSTKHTIGRTCEIPDPDQIRLAFDDDKGTVRMVSGGKDTGEVPLNKFTAAVNKVTAKKN